MSNVLKYRRLEREDIPKVLTLQEEVFGVSWDENYLEWKYFQYPVGEHSIFIALDGEKVVGQVGGIPYILSVNQKEIKSTHELDAVVLPEYKKKGAFIQTAKHTSEWDKKKQIFNFVFSNEKTYPIITRMLKFRDVCSVFRLAKILDPTPFLQEKIKIQFLANIFGYVGKIFISARSKITTFRIDEKKIEEIKRFDNALTLSGSKWPVITKL